MKTLLCICVLVPIYHLPSFLLLSLSHSGAQGEFAGLCAIMAYHRDRGEEHRKVRIPPPPHTTHPLTHTHVPHPHTPFFPFFSPSLSFSSLLPPFLSLVPPPVLPSLSLSSSLQICLIPQSAHGTNPASAQMAGLDVVYIPTDKDGSVSVAEFKKKVTQRDSSNLRTWKY